MSSSSSGGRDRIPFYRNVKTIGILAQIIFAVVIVVGAFILYNNVTSALSRSNIPADFSFLTLRAGVPIAETPIPYDTSDPYWYAFLVGVVNTLKVALVGVVLASLLGVSMGMMRLSSNWMLRRIASTYVETVRNVPLALQIVFWFTAVLTPLPPRIKNPIDLPGGILLSNLGIALPWLYPSYRFGAWLPWLVAAVILFVGIFLFRRWQIARSERPGNPWLAALAGLVVVAAAGYWLAGSGLPETVTVDFRPDRGRGTVFYDADGDGEYDVGEEAISYAPTRVSIEEAVIRTFSRDFTEGGGLVYSTFRFPPFDESDYKNAEVTFGDPEEAEGLSIHFNLFPSEGVIYRDRNNNEQLDPGEQLREGDGGFVGVSLILHLSGFQRRIVANRSGQIRIPDFEAEIEEIEAGEERATNLSPTALFRSPATEDEADEVVLDPEIDLLPGGPLVLSVPSVPVSNYFGGIVLSTSYLALLLALVVYTSTFIAEIVRGGIQAVPKGQTEAAKAVGLSGYQTFSLVIFPQALRIILPPMISQYLNLTKNSSLAPLAAYAELFAISIIIANQTGASVPVIIMILVSYIIISLTFAFVLNIVNARIALVER